MGSATILKIILSHMLINQGLASARTNSSLIHTRDSYEHLFVDPFTEEHSYSGTCLYYFPMKPEVNFFQAATYCFLKNLRLPQKNIQNDMTMVNNILGQHPEINAIWIINPDDANICYVASYNSGGNPFIYSVDCNANYFAVVVRNTALKLQVCQDLLGGRTRESTF